MVKLKLLFAERLVIEREVRLGCPVGKIAELLGRNHSVISRELKPDKDQGLLPYSARRAQLRADRLARHGRRKKLEKNPHLRAYVVDKLTDDWSPEQIVGRLTENPPKKLIGQHICLETIYQFVYSLARDEKGGLLYTHLRRAKPKRIRRYSRKSQAKKIPERISIHDRPTLTGYGHWESDTVFGKQNQPVSVQYEKKSQLVRLHKLANQSSKENREAIEDTLESLPISWRQTMTFDNGTENYQHNQLPLKTYFCDPYSAWQKGGVENANQLLRQYIPKRADLNHYTPKNIHDIQEKLNNRPRKGLKYKTPNEILAQSGAFVSRT